jgi:hypothetical protein
LTTLTTVAEVAAPGVGDDPVMRLVNEAGVPVRPALELTVTVAVKVSAVELTGRLAMLQVAPEQLKWSGPPVCASELTVTPDADTASVIEYPAAFDGPAFFTVIVYVP